MPSLTDLRNRKGEIIELARARGASRVRVFGSVARGDATEASDIDFLVDLDEGRNLLDLGGLLMDLRDLLGHDVDVAIESAGIVLASSDPRGVAKIVTLSKATYRKMIQNLAWATGYNTIAIPLAAGVTAGLGFVLSPAIGAVLMSLSTIVVAVNAQFLRKLDLG